MIPFIEIDTIAALENPIMASIPTIKIVNPDGEGYAIINESDFNPKLHTKWEQRKQSKPKKESSQDGTETLSNDESADRVLARIQELEQVYQSSGWRAIADLAETLGIEKPDEGWRAAIPLIAQKELDS